MIAKVGSNISRYIKISKQSITKLPNIHNIRLADQASYYFAQSSRDKIVRELQEQMQYYRQNLPQQDAQNQEYFKKQGWSIVYDQHKTLYSFSKSAAKFDIHIFTHVKSNPPNLQKQQQQPQKEQPKQEKINYAQLLVWIKKQQTNKWMVAQMGVLEGNVELTTVHFTDLKPGIGWQRHVYAGPDVMSLPEEVLKVVNSVFQRVGLKTQLLMNMVLYASGKSDQLDYKWMQNFKQVLS